MLLLEKKLKQPKLQKWPQLTFEMKRERERNYESDLILLTVATIHFFLLFWAEITQKEIKINVIKNFLKTHDL